MPIKIRSGALDCRIAIQSFAETQDSAGQPVKTWSNFASVWADVLDVGSRERFRSEQRIATRATRFRIRYRSGITEEMRVVDGDTTYEITGIAKKSRHGWLELSCEAINPAATD